MEKKRLIWADSLKGWLIILVVLGHAIQVSIGSACESNHLWNIIYSFHMPAFMAVSGFFAFRPNAFIMVDQYKPLLNRRFGQLMTPFFIWTFLLLLLNTDFSWDTIGIYFVKPHKGIWFLWVLFFINLFFIIGQWLAGIIKVKKGYVILLICLLLSFVMVVFNPRIFGFQLVSYYFLFYAMGYYIHKYWDLLITKNKAIIVSVSLCWLVLAWFWNMHNLPAWFPHFFLPISLLQYTYRFVTATFAIYVLFAISPLILDCNKWYNKPFVNLGILSLGIYTTHYIIVIGRVVKLCRNFCQNEAMIIIYSFVITLLVSWLIVYLLNKWKVTAKYMLGKV